MASMTVSISILFADGIAYYTVSNEGHVLQNEYPHKWPSFWTDLLGMLPEGPGVVDMFCRILIAIDDDVISLDIAR